VSIKNPYGVNLTRYESSDQKRQCECCGLEFTFRGRPIDEASWPRRCEPCANHIPHGSLQQQVYALKDHCERSRLRAEQAYAMTKQAYEEKAKADDDRKHDRRALAEVIGTRNMLRRQLGAVLALHQPLADGRCQCGEHPCPEREALIAVGAATDNADVERELESLDEQREWW
jgi:hypothetical protein